MVLFSERNKLSEEYKLWLNENPQAEDSPFNVITFLDSRNLLRNFKNKEQTNSESEMLWSWNERDDENWTHGTFERRSNTGCFRL